MIPLKIRTKDDCPPEVPLRRWNEVMRTAHAAVGRQWHQEMLPRHFTPEAKAKYGHKPRTAKYLKAKQRLARLGKAILGGIVDNVLTGNMMRLLQLPSVLRASPKRVSIAMVGPRYLSMIPRNPERPNKAQEILRVTPDEEAILDATFDREFTIGLAALREPRET